MGAEDWIRSSLIFVQILVAIFGLYFVIKSIKQKTNADDRAEWFRRFTWAMEHVNDDRVSNRAAAFEVLEQLAGQDLTTATESRLALHIEDMVEAAMTEYVEVWDEDLAKEIDSWDNSRDRPQSEGGDGE